MEMNFSEVRIHCRLSTPDLREDGSSLVAGNGELADLQEIAHLVKIVQCFVSAPTNFLVMHDIDVLYK